MMMYGSLEESSHIIGEDFKQYTLNVFSEGQREHSKNKRQGYKKKRRWDWALVYKRNGSPVNLPFPPSDHVPSADKIAE